MQPNPFLEHADVAIPRAVKARDKRRALKTREQADRDRRALLAMHREAWSALRRQLVAERPLLGELIEICDAVGPDNGDELIRCAVRGSSLPVEHRQFLLSVIAVACQRARQDLGLPPFDDPLPGEPNNIFLDAKEILSCR